MVETRKLAAILCSDVVGYSRLAGADEDRILARLRALRSDLIDPTIAVHHGRIVKRTGDGSIVEFRSVVDAVRCGIEVQNAMVERNAGVPEDRRIVFRIGIHLGDVVEESDGDLMGDGVNIAARLEGIAAPGAICLSEQAYWQVKGRLDLAVTDLGPTNLKNIADPVRAYSLQVGVPAVAKPAIAAKPLAPKKRFILAPLAAGIAALLAIVAGGWYFLGASWIATVAPPASIVVLPFVNLSGDPAQQYLADVLTEGLTTTLAQWRGTFVIARSTAFTYKGKSVDVKEIGRELGVRYVLEGSEQHSGGKVRVNAQLIDAETGAHLSAEQFDANQSELLEMQDEIVTRIARDMGRQWVAADVAHAARTRSGSLETDDLALRCLAASLKPETFGAATTLCQQALKVDDRNVWARCIVSLSYSVPVIDAQSTDRAGDLQKADELASRALALDPDNYFAHLAKALVLIGQMRTEQAVAELERSLALNPSNVNTYGTLATAYNFLGQPDRALEFADKAIRLSPRDPWTPEFYHMKGWALFMKQQYDQAIEWLRLVGSGKKFTELLLASAYSLTGQQAEAHEALQRYLALPGVASKSIAQLRAQQLALANNPTWVEYNERLFDGLRKAGMPEN